MLMSFRPFYNIKEKFVVMYAIVVVTHDAINVWIWTYVPTVGVYPDIPIH